MTLLCQAVLSQLRAMARTDRDLSNQSWCHSPSSCDYWLLSSQYLNNYTVNDPVYRGDWNSSNTLDSYSRTTGYSF